MRKVYQHIDTQNFDILVLFTGGWFTKMFRILVTLLTKQACMYFNNFTKSRQQNFGWIFLKETYVFMYYFNNGFECFVTVSKHEKTMNSDETINK